MNNSYSKILFGVSKLCFYVTSIEAQRKKNISRHSNLPFNWLIDKIEEQCDDIKNNAKEIILKMANNTEC